MVHVLEKGAKIMSGFTLPVVGLMWFLSRDATLSQSAFMPQYVVCLSVCPWRSETVIT